MPRKEILSIGGQAVVEGVMMRTQDTAAVAVRTPTGKITSKRMRIRHGKLAKKLLRIPFVRGSVFLVETFTLGFRAINYSAAASTGGQEEEGGAGMALLLLISILAAVALFIALPFFLAKAVVGSHGFLFNLMDGIVRIAVFVLYLLLISLLADVRALFAYHGAEHMTVAAFEDKKPLRIREIRRYSRLHPRCGTAFLLIVLIVSILVFSLVTSPSVVVKFASRILLLPVIAGISYEALKFGGKNHQNPLVAALVYPGLLLQRITTREPTDAQIEVAIASLKAAIK